MLNLANTEELVKLNLKLIDYKGQRRRKKSKIEDWEKALEKLEKERFEIEEGLQATVDTIARRLEKISDNTKFRTVYFEEAKSRILNAKSSEALTHIQDSEKTVKGKISALEEEVEKLDRKILKTEDRIRQLSQQE